jgi:hypothetical protein
MLAQEKRNTSRLYAASQGANTSPAGQFSRPNTVKARLTPKRRQRQVENDEYSAFVRRVLRAYSRRVGDGDVEALALMLDLAEEVDSAIADAVMGLRACGYSWAEIASRLGITRQAAQQRWGMPKSAGQSWGKFHGQSSMVSGHLGKVSPKSLDTILGGQF